MFRKCQYCGEKLRSREEVYLFTIVSREDGDEIVRRTWKLCEDCGEDKTREIKAIMGE